MSDAKTLPTEVPVSDFLNTVENKRRRTDADLLLKLFSEITNLPAVMWGPSMIGFGQYRYQYDSGRSGIMLAAGFSPRKSNLSIYVSGDFEGAESLFEKLGKHKRSVACLYINKLEDVDLAVLKDIIRLDFAHTIKKHNA